MTTTIDGVSQTINDYISHSSFNYVVKKVWITNVCSLQVILNHAQRDASLYIFAPEYQLKNGVAGNLAKNNSNVNPKTIDVTTTTPGQYSIVIVYKLSGNRIS